LEFHLSAFISGVYLLQPKPKLLMKAIREAGQVSDTQKSLSEWLEEAGNRVENHESPLCLLLSQIDDLIAIKC